MRFLIAKYIVTGFLLINFYPAYGAWTAIGSNEKTTVLADPDTMKVDGSIIQINHMLNFKVIGKDPENGADVKSIFGVSQFNCSSQEYRSLNQTFYSEVMGSGDRVNVKNTPSSNWEKIQSGTWVAGVFNSACNDFIQRASQRKAQDTSAQSNSKEVMPPVKIISPPPDPIGIVKAKCSDLGFKQGTENFGKCVLRLSK